ncbi:MAG TPA: hypothetical protein PKC76_02775 [Saprospiraceae bacterium]|nr:hypothetical protein [Saprospiraceae bacterium]HMP23025.1 hypothetical protein [Saprospiraceae bacterium]
MKTILLSVACSLLSLLAMAQHETIFSNAKVVGGFGGPITEFGLGNGLTTSYGGGGAVVIGGAFLGGYGLSSFNLNEVIRNNTFDQIELAHGGFWVGYTYQPYKLVHLFSSAKIGWGAVNISTDNFDPFNQRSDQVFVMTPELGLELNVFKWFRVAGTVGYRWVNGTNGDGQYTDEDFSGAISTLTLRFGWFGNKRF